VVLAQNSWSVGEKILGSLEAVILALFATLTKIHSQYGYIDNPAELLTAVYAVAATKKKGIVTTRMCTRSTSLMVSVCK